MLLSARCLSHHTTYHIITSSLCSRAAAASRTLTLCAPAANRRHVSVMSGGADAVLPERAAAVLSYWFGPDYAQRKPITAWAGEEQTRLWFRGGPEVDQYIKDHFAGDIAALASGGYDSWLKHPLSAVAGIVLADQFTRNVYRGSAESFSLDGKALEWSHTMRQTWDLRSVLPSPPLWYFAHMPLMHSESLKDQDLLIELVDQEILLASQADPDSPAAKQWRDIRKFACGHRDVVAKWGRFPHRNVILGREFTPEEEAGLADGSIPKW